jgi:hypothetical protein
MSRAGFKAARLDALVRQGIGNRQKIFTLE